MILCLEDPYLLELVLSAAQEQLEHKYSLFEE